MKRDTAGRGVVLVALMLVTAFAAPAFAGRPCPGRRAAADGEPVALETMAAYHDRLARGLAGVINILDPAVIVLGGGVSNIESIYTAVPAIWAEYVFSGQVLTSLVPAAHGDSSGVRGAAWLWNV